MKGLIILFTCIMLIGCNPNKESVSNNSSSCRAVPKIWWGEKGENPAKNKLWKCYNWKLKAR